MDKKKEAEEKAHKATQLAFEAHEASDKIENKLKMMKET